MQVGYRQRQRLLLLLATAAMLVAAVLAYYPGLHGPFLFDDNPNIADNPALRLASLAPHDLLRAAFSSRSGVLYRPISMLSFAFNIYFFGNNSFSFKLTNLVIHLCNALLLLWLTRRLLLNCRRRYQFAWPDTRINWFSVLVAAAWMLHPLNLTSVLYIVQRMNSLSALFTLAGMLAYVYGRERMLAGKTGWPLVWLLTPAFGLIGVLCKEDAALLPLYLLVIEWLVFGFRNRQPGISKNTLVFYLFGLVIPGVLGFAFLLHNPGWFLGGYAGRNFTLEQRVLTEFRVVASYIQWTFYPDIRDFALYHDIAASHSLFTPLSTLWSLLALMALAGVAWLTRKRRPLFCLGIFFFFAGQAMESTILPLELVFEHRNYLPDYGLLLAAFSLLLLPGPGAQRQSRAALRWGIAALSIPVLFSVTLLRASEWDNFLDFSYYEAQHHPHSERALYTLGQEYSNLALSGAIQDPAIAFQALSRAAALSTNIMPDTAMMMVSAKLKLPVNPAWQKHAENILRAYPLSTQDTDSLSSLVHCIHANCQALTPSAYAMIQTAFHSKNIEKLPGSQADLWAIYANYLTFTGAPLGEIVTAMRHSVELAPNESQYRINLAKGLIMSGDIQGAEAQILQLSRLNLFGSLDLEIRKLNDNLAAARSTIDKARHPRGG